jgi:hypothetical protein
MIPFIHSFIHSFIGLTPYAMMCRPFGAGNGDFYYFTLKINPLKCLASSSPGHLALIWST